MKKSNLLLMVAALNLIGCGYSKEELESRERAKMDSVAVATETNLVHEKAVQDSIAAAEVNQAVLKAQLIDLKGQLAGEESKLNSTEQFKLLRTADEKAAQIAEQTKIVEELKAQIEEIEKQIME